MTTHVLKIGGGREINHRAIFTNLKRRLDAGERWIVIHGANHEMRVVSEKLGKPPKMITSVSGVESRYTDRETMEIFTMVYRGSVNAALVSLCQELGIDAVGLCGCDGRSIQAERKKALRVVENGRRMVIHDDYSGRIERVDPRLFTTLLDNGFMPLVCPPAISAEFEPLNVDGDRAGAMIAGAMRAERYVLLSNVPGLLRDKDDEATLIRRIERSRMDEFEGFAAGRMKKKTMGATEALELGVREVIFADGRAEAPLDRALSGEGTVIS